MKIGDLFINIAIANPDKAISALSSVKNGMMNLGAEGLATKAAILGVVYGLEHFMSKSAEAGMALSQFAGYTGLSTSYFQKLQISARQSGVDVTELQSSVVGLQESIAKMRFDPKAGPPGGLAMLSAWSGGLDPTKIDNPYYLLEKMSKFAKQQKLPQTMRNEFLKQMGAGMKFTNWLREMDFSKVEQLKNPFTESQILQLKKVSVAWANLGAKVDIAWGKITARHGLELTKEISGLTIKIFELTDSLIKLAENTHIFKWIGKSFEGWDLILQDINSQVKDMSKGIDDSKDAADLGKHAFSGMKDKLDTFFRSHRNRKNAKRT